MRRFGWLMSAVLVAGLGAAMAHAQGVADVISARQAGYKATGGNMGAIKKVMDAGGDLSTVAANATDVANWGRKIPSMFPVGSGPESNIKTAALPEIWANKADFDKLAGNLATEADKLAVALKANDKAAAATAFAATGGTCGACHRTYRAKAS